MVTSEHVYDEMELDSESTVSSSIETCITSNLETSLSNNGIAFVKNNLTSSNEGVLVQAGRSTYNNDLINYNKPWRKVIRRSVIDVGNDNES